MGACFGFLWWNASPAKIFMGDTGSLGPRRRASPAWPSRTRTELLLVLLGGLFVLITLSVILQVGFVQADRQTRVPDGAAAAPLRAGRLGRGHDRHPLLDHRRAVRRPRPRGSSTPSGWRARRSDPARREPGGADPPRRRLVRAARPRRRPRRLRLRRGRRAARARRARHRRRRPGAGGESEASASAPTSSRSSAPTVRLGDGARDRSAGRDVDLVVTSPGLAPRPAAAARGRRAPASRSGARSSSPGGCAPRPAPRPWLTVTGTNGKTTTVEMLASMLRAAGLRAVARRQRRHAAARGRAAPRAATTSSPSSSPASSCTGQRSVPPLASACLNVAPDHLDWHGCSRSTLRAKGKIYAAHPGRLRLQRRRPGRPSSWSRRPTSSRAAARSASPSACPAPSMLGSSTTCSSTAPSSRRGRTAAELARSPTCRATRRRRPAQRRQRARRRRAGPRVRRAARCRPRRAAGLPARPAPHRRRRDASTGSAYVDDSKATNPHAAARRCARTTHVVWIAGGLLKGADVDDLVARGAPTGCAAWSCSAPTGRRSPRRSRDTRRMSRSSTWSETDATLESMDDASSRAPPSSPQPGDTVLLAPAAARWTCSPTTAPAATPSRPPCAGCAEGPRGDEHDDPPPPAARPGRDGAGAAGAERRRTGRCRSSRASSRRHHLLRAARRRRRCSSSSGWSWCSRPRA